jgi:hypothetical protein
MRPLGTGLDTPFAADAFLLIDHANVTVFRVDVCGAHRTILDAQGRNALPARSHDNVERVLGKRGSVADDLDARQGRIRLALMSHGTGEHAALTAKAQAAVVGDITGGLRISYLGLGRRGYLRGGRRNYGKSTGSQHGATAGQEIASQDCFRFDRFGGFSHRTVLFFFFSSFGISNAVLPRSRIADRLPGAAACLPRRVPRGSTPLLCSRQHIYLDCARASTIAGICGQKVSGGAPSFRKHAKTPSSVAPCEML